MSSTESGRVGDAVVAERRVTATDDGYRAAVDVRAGVDATLVARLVDDLPGGEGVDAVRLAPETEPPRWIVEDGRLIFETLVGPEGGTSVVYDVRADDLPEGTAPVAVELAQPVEFESPDGADTGAEAAVPAFRDARTFDGGRAGEFIATATAADGDPSADRPDDGGGTDVDTGDAAEATDDDVRRALRSVTGPDTDELVEDEVPTLDLADPPESDGEADPGGAERRDA